MASNKPIPKKKPIGAFKKGHVPPCAIKPGECRNPAGGPPGKRLLTRIREMLQERSLKKDGRYNERFDDVANAFVAMMEKGSFIHAKEFIDREEGKVPNRLAGSDGKNLKLYVGMPVDDDDPETP